MALTRDDLERIVAGLSFRDWKFALRYDDKRPYLQLRFEEPCTKGTSKTGWSGRKWMLSPHMTSSEVVRTAWKAVQAAVEHEAAETFKYRGIPVYNPHIDIEALRTASQIEDVRT